MENNFTENTLSSNLNDQSNSNLTLNLQAQEALQVSAKWCMFLSIMGFIGIAFMVILGLLMTMSFSSLPTGMEGTPFASMRSYLSIFYIILAALYFPPIYYLYQYSVGIKNALFSKNADNLSDALVALKSHHKFLGISLIVFMSLYILIIIGTIAAFAIR